MKKKDSQNIDFQHFCENFETCQNLCINDNMQIDFKKESKYTFSKFWWKIWEGAAADYCAR